MSSLLSVSLLVLLVSHLYAFQFGNRLASRNNFMLRSTEEVNADPIHQLFVGNLPFDVEEQDLTDAVTAKIGDEYKAIKIAKDRRTGKSRGFGYIHFEDQEKSEAAVTALSGLEVGGREVRVDIAAQKSEGRPRPNRAPQENSVFIGNLNFEVTNSDIEQLISDVLGTDKECKVRLLFDRDTGRSRGFGHIDFSSPEEAKNAIEVLNGIEVMGRSIRVDHAQRRDPAERQERGRQNVQNRENSVFLGNLAWDITSEMCIEMLTDVLGPDGGFTNVRLATDRETGRPRGFGHIDFKDKESAERAITELNGMEVLGRLLRVDFAQRKEDRPPQNF